MDVRPPDTRAPTVNSIRGSTNHIRALPAVEAKPERAEEVLYRLRAIILSVRSDGLIKANEEFTAWLRGERSMPFGPTTST